MTREEMEKLIDYTPTRLEYEGRESYSDMFEPFEDNKRSFAGYEHHNSNELGRRHRMAALAMCKDAR